MKKKSVSKKIYCDFLWSVLIKAIAGFESELNGETDGLTAHHLRGKPNYWLRYSIKNGFCCTTGQHKYGFHHTGRRPEVEKQVIEIRGGNTFADLEALTHRPDSPNINSIQIDLIEQLKPYKKQIEKYFKSKNYKNTTIIKNYKTLLDIL